jgi:pyruvate,water dikinase
MTPLFGDWVLPRIEAGFAGGMRATAGTSFDFPRAAVNGWFYATPQPAITGRRLLAAVAATRGRLLPFMYHALVQPMCDPPGADEALLGGLYRRWRERRIPEYQALVDGAEAEVDTAAPQRLVGLVDQIARTAGVHLWYLAIVGGAAWKMERALARFARKHLPDVLPDGVIVLVSGLMGGAQPPPWAVSSIDWYQPTFGEYSGSAGGVAPERARQGGQPGATRRAAERTCREALADRPRLLRRFTRLVAVAQRYAAIREEQARELTLGWPVLRRAVHRLGRTLHTAGVVDDPDDVFFLTRAELATGLDGGPPRMVDAVAGRRAVWLRQRRLAAPLSLGTAPRLLRAVLAGLHPAPHTRSDTVIAGQAASPGRATGRVRVVQGADQFGRFIDGEILVAPSTTPAWTMLLTRAAAIVTDGGNLAAHASLVAREYAIPAVVATGDATHRLFTGQVVTVDGTAGTVTPASVPTQVA